MHELLIEGYVRQIERDHQSAQRWTPVTIHRAANDGCVPQRAPKRCDPVPLHGRLLRASGALLVSIGLWLEEQAGSITPS